MSGAVRSRDDLFYAFTTDTDVGRSCIAPSPVSAYVTSGIPCWHTTIESASVRSYGMGENCLRNTRSIVKALI